MKYLVTWKFVGDLTRNCQCCYFDFENTARSLYDELSNAKENFKDVRLLKIADSSRKVIMVKEV